MVACILYNVINIIAWGTLAYHFEHWWIALFAVVTQLHYSHKREDKEG